MTISIHLLNFWDNLLYHCRLQRPELDDRFRVLVKHRQPVTSVALSDDDLKGFSASKDGTILQWDVNGGKHEKYHWPSEEILKSHGVKDPQGRASKHSKNVLALAVSSEGRYLASGGLDRHVHLWDTRTREHIQVILFLLYTGLNMWFAVWLTSVVT